MKSTAAIVIAGAALLGGPAFSQSAHDHAGHQAAAAMAAPRAPGQDTFAAIAEIVGILDADPATDWLHIDIGALHRHLLDMDALFTRTSVTEERIPLGLKMTIAKGGAGGGAAGRMVPAHAPLLEVGTGWTSTVDVDVDDEAIVWTITAASEAEAVRMQGLGFYGLMATGAHHQRHHLAIARGEPMH